MAEISVKQSLAYFNLLEGAAFSSARPLLTFVVENPAPAENWKPMQELQRWPGCSLYLDPHCRWLTRSLGRSEVQ